MSDCGQQVVRAARPARGPRRSRACRPGTCRWPGSASRNGAEHLGQPPADAAEARRCPPCCGCRSRVGRRMNSFFCWARKNTGRLRHQAGHQGDRVLGHLVGQHARGAGDRDVRRDHRGHQAVVHAGGRRLDPPQPALADHAVPIDRHLGVAAEDVGRETVPRRSAPGRRRRSRPRAWRRRSAGCAWLRRDSRGRFAWAIGWVTRSRRDCGRQRHAVASCERVRRCGSIGCSVETMASGEPGVASRAVSNEPASHMQQTASARAMCRATLPGVCKFSVAATYNA